MFQLEVPACFSELLNTCFLFGTCLNLGYRGDPSNPQQDFASVRHHSDVFDNHDSGYLGMAVQLYVQAHLPLG